MKPFVIGIAGGTGSGKTTVARRIYESLHLDAAVFLDQDSYYREMGHLPLEERKKLNFDHPDSLDNDLLAEHLRRLVDRQAIEKPVYDFSAHTRTGETSGSSRATWCSSRASSSSSSRSSATSST